MAQPGGEAPVRTLGSFAIEKKRQPLSMAELGGLGIVLQFGEGARHAGQAKGAELIDGGMGEQGHLLQW